MNCKVGDLAVIIKAIHPENLGAIVEVLAPGEQTDEYALPHWHVKSVGRELRFTYLRQQDVGLAEDVFMWDKDLRPIRPDDALDELPADLRTDLERTFKALRGAGVNDFIIETMP